MPSQVADILWLRRAWIPMWMSDFIQLETSSLKLAVAWTETSSIQPTVCDPLPSFKQSIQTAAPQRKRSPTSSMSTPESCCNNSG